MVSAFLPPWVVKDFAWKGQFIASQGRINKETNWQFSANSPPPTLTFCQKGVH